MRCWPFHCTEKQDGLLNREIDHRGAKSGITVVVDEVENAGADDHFLDTGVGALPCVFLARLCPYHSLETMMTSVKP